MSSVGRFVRTLNLVVEMATFLPEHSLWPGCFCRQTSGMIMMLLHGVSAQETFHRSRPRNPRGWVSLPGGTRRK